MASYACECKTAWTNVEAKMNRFFKAILSETMFLICLAKDVHGKPITLIYCRDFSIFKT